MERPDRDIITVLIKVLLTRGLISESACSSALDLVYSVKDFPELLQDLVPVKKGGE